jgi:hypothetical protein
MARRKLRIYCDADLDQAVEQALCGLNQINGDSARRSGTTTRGDPDHFHFAAKHRRVLITHDDGYLNSDYSIMETHGVIVISRGQGATAVVTAFLKFLLWAWVPLIRDQIPAFVPPGHESAFVKS